MADPTRNAGELIPPPDLAPPSLKGTTMQQRIVMWRQLMDLAEQFLLAGLRRKVGPDGDLEAAYRRWYQRRMQEHDRAMLQMGQTRQPSGGADGR